MKFGSLKNNWYSLFDRYVDDSEKKILELLVFQVK